MALDLKEIPYLSLNAVKKGDKEAWLALYEDDATVEDPVGGHPHFDPEGKGQQGKAAIGKPLESLMTAGYLDTRVHALYDKVPALCYGPISQNIHGVDERVSVESVKRITKTMALFIAEWCGLEPYKKEAAP